MATPIYFKGVEIRTACFDKKNLSEPTKPHRHVNGLPAGGEFADAISFGLKNGDIAIGVYDIAASMRKWVGDGKTVYYFDLVTAVPVK